MDKRIFLAAVGLALLAQPAFADTRDDVLAAMQRCQAIHDDRVWLDCTYGAEQPMRARLGLPPAPEYQQRLVPPVAPFATSVDPRNAPPTALPRRRASLMQILTGSAPPIAVSALASLRYDSQGAFIITLANGQVWRQVDESGQKARLKIGTGVTIRPGALSSFNMQTDDNPHLYKVERRS